LAKTIFQTAPTPEELSVMDGEWIFVEDKTEGRALEQLGPPMASKFLMKVENGAIILNGHGSGHKNVRVTLDGTVTEIKEPTTISRYRGSWKDGSFEYEVAFERLGENTPQGIKSIKRMFRNTPEGLLVTVVVDPPMGSGSTAIYKLAKDIPMPTPAKATISDLAWISGAWVGKRSSGTEVEERWSPPKGGAMLATSRSVNTSGRMSAFEFLRINEREGGLVYVAQPGGAPPTEFILTEWSSKRAVFDNPRHDYPKRIVYELTESGGLVATTGYIKGGTPRRFEFKREEK
jgi:hypothetical protein